MNTTNSLSLGGTAIDRNNPSPNSTSSSWLRNTTFTDNISNLSVDVQVSYHFKHFLTQYLFLQPIINYFVVKAHDKWESQKRVVDFGS